MIERIEELKELLKRTTITSQEFTVLEIPETETCAFAIMVNHENALFSGRKSFVFPPLMSMLD